MHTSSPLRFTVVLCQWFRHLLHRFYAILPVNIQPLESREKVEIADPLISTQRVVEKLETKVAVLQAEVLKHSLKVRVNHVHRRCVALRFFPPPGVPQLPPPLR